MASQSEETCSALRNLGSGSSDVELDCTPNDDCDHVTCTGSFTSPSLSILNSLGLMSSLTLLPCQEPDRIAVALSIFTSTREIDTYIYTESNTERVFNVGSFRVTMSVVLNQLPNGIEIAVSELELIHYTVTNYVR